MAISLYDLSVASYLQTLGGVVGFLERGHAHLTANNINPDEFADFRLAADMLPFRFQLQSVAHHSLGAIEGIKQGAFAPPPKIEPLGYRGLQKMVGEARETLQKLTPAEINALEERDVVFSLGKMQIPFTAEGFVMTFSLPNFYFHAATAYDMLRLKGVPLGKRDYMGQMRMKS